MFAPRHVVINTKELEDAASRMNRLGRNELIGVEHLSVDELVQRIVKAYRHHRGTGDGK